MLYYHPGKSENESVKIGWEAVLALPGPGPDCRLPQAQSRFPSATKESPKSSAPLTSSGFISCATYVPPIPTEREIRQRTSKCEKAWFSLAIESTPVICIQHHDLRKADTVVAKSTYTKMRRRLTPNPTRRDPKPVNLRFAGRTTATHRPVHR